MPTPRTYCSREDVKYYLPKSIVPETDDDGEPNWRNPAPTSLTNVEIDFFIQQACQMIDAAIGTIYDIPLRRANLGGVITYPGPVPMIAAIVASQLIFEQRLQGADKERSQSQEEREKWAAEELARIQNGERKLVGQRFTRGSRMVRSSLYNAPKNPAEGGRSQGKG